MIAFLLSLLFFGLIYYIERRSLWLGFAFLVLGLGTVILVLSVPVFQNNQWLYLFLALLAILVLFLTITGPFLFILACLYNGTKLLRREGVRLTNLLSLGLGLGIILYLFILPWVLGTFHLSNTWFNFIYLYVGMLLAYLFFQSALYTLSSFLNFINIGRQRLDFVVVLGAGLIGEEVTPLLAARLDKGIKILNKHPESKLIVSGGQGPDEVISEAQAMANYALKKGVAPDRLVLENQSRNTYENIQFSYQLMPQGSHFAVVTNYYHLFRALLIAKTQKIKCIGYGAKTKFYFSLNAFIREFVGYLVMTRRKHLIVLGVITAVYIGIFIVDAWLQTMR